jgi:threonine aldolase
MTTDDVIDLRSDTVTRPSPAMRRAMAEAEVGDDVLDGDPTVARLEARVAELLGKPRALFFPTGTMANQAGRVAAGASRHRGAASTPRRTSSSGSTPGSRRSAACSRVRWRRARAAGDGRRGARRGRPPPVAPRAARVARGAGEHAQRCRRRGHAARGTARPADVAAEHGLPVHLDGARLWNACAATGTAPSEFAACAETVMVSFSKGLGAPGRRGARRE